METFPRGDNPTPAFPQSRKRADRRKAMETCAVRSPWSRRLLWGKRAERRIAMEAIIRLIGVNSVRRKHWRPWFDGIHGIIMGNALIAERQWRQESAILRVAVEAGIGNWLNAERQWRPSATGCHLKLGLECWKQSKPKGNGDKLTPPRRVNWWILLVGNVLNAECQGRLNWCYSCDSWAL